MKRLEDARMKKCDHRLCGSRKGWMRGDGRSRGRGHEEVWIWEGEEISRITVIGITVITIIEKGRWR